jgi:transposase
LLGVDKTVIERIEYDEDADVVVARMRPTRSARGRWGVPATVPRLRRRGRPAAVAGAGSGHPAGGAGGRRAAGAVRRTRVVVAHVPWARHGAGHTYAFDDTVAWLAVQCSKAAVTELMRIAWRTVGAIVPGCGPTGSAGTTGSPGCAATRNRLDVPDHPVHRHPGVVAAVPHHVLRRGRGCPRCS